MPFPLCFLAAGLITVGLLLFQGCQARQKPSESHLLEPVEVRLNYQYIEKKAPYLRSFATRLFLPQVATVVSGRLDGWVLGFLYRPDGGIFRSLYLIDPHRKTAEKVYQPPSGLWIAAAVSEGDYLAVVIRDKTRWRLLVRKLSGKEELVIDKGAYLKAATGDDYPSLALSGDTLVYNTTRQEGGTFTSQIIKCDLPTGRKEIIFRVVGPDVYTGPPSICGRYIAWHVGKWDREGSGELYPYDAGRQTSRRLDVPGNNITPAIWGRYLVYVTYDKNHPAAKNIAFYDLVSGKAKRLTDATPGNQFEYWRPTIAHGVVGWFANHREERVPFCVVKKEAFEKKNNQKLTIEIKSPTYYARCTPSWIVWHEADPEGGMKKGTYFAGLFELWNLVALAGTEVVGAVDGGEIFAAVRKGRKRPAELEPPEAAALYYEAISRRHFDLVASLALPGAVSVEQWVEELKKEPPDIPARISRDYLIQGNRAYVLAEGLSAAPEGFLLHMTRENGVWKMDQCAGQ